MAFTLPRQLREHPFCTEIAVLFQTAMAIFVFTVVVGILNGTDMVDFSDKTILTHVHTGTLGWLTLSVFAASLWLFGRDEGLTPAMRLTGRLLSYGAIVAFLAYNYMFFTTYGEGRPTVGGFAVVAIVGFFLWVLWRIPHVELTTPHAGVLAAIGTSVAGGVLGVLLGIRLATGNKVLPEGGEDAHPATMVIGFLIPVGMALAEWALTWPRPARVTRLGVLQMVLPFVGGVLVMTGLLLDVTPLTVLSLPFEIGGVGIFVYRMWPKVRAIDWLARSGARFAAMTVLFIPADIALFVYLVQKYEGDLDLAPTHEILALDHTMFIGAMTNALFGLLFAASAERQSRWPLVDHFVVVAMNVGLLGFAAGLFWDVTELKRIFTPIMGGALLLALATFTLRLQASHTETEEAAAAA